MLHLLHISKNLYVLIYSLFIYNANITNILQIKFSCIKLTKSQCTFMNNYKKNHHVNKNKLNYKLLLINPLFPQTLETHSTIL